MQQWPGSRVRLWQSCVVPSSPALDSVQSYIRATSELHPSDVRATSEPRPNHVQATSKPHPSHIRATSEPHPNQIRTTSEPDPHHFQATSEPHPSHIRTTSEPRPNHIQATSEPHPSQGRPPKGRPASLSFLPALPPSPLALGCLGLPTCRSQRRQFVRSLALPTRRPWRREVVRSCPLRGAWRLGKQGLPPLLLPAFVFSPKTHPSPLTDV